MISFNLSFLNPYIPSVSISFSTFCSMCFSIIGPKVLKFPSPKLKAKTFKPKPCSKNTVTPNPKGTMVTQLKFLNSNPVRGWRRFGVILGIHRDSGKENGNYYKGLTIRGFWVLRERFGLRGFQGFRVPR